MSRRGAFRFPSFGDGHPGQWVSPVRPNGRSGGEVFEPVGCDKCNNTGYKGRIGVYEAFHVTPEMEKLVMSNPSMADITALAIKQGMITMRQDAYLKLLDGITSFDEIERILG